MAVSRIVPRSFLEVRLSFMGHNRRQSVAAVADAEDVAFGFTSDELSSAKPYEAIPSPPSVPFLGNFFAFKPFGKLDAFNRKACCDAMKETYGPITRISLPFVGAGFSDFVEVLDPKDFEIVFRNEGKYPGRPQDPVMLKYRTKRGQSLGLFLENDEEWWKIRQPVNKTMMRANAAYPYLDSQDPVGVELVEKLRRDMAGSSDASNIMSELYRYSLESVCTVIFDARLGSLAPNLPDDAWQNKFLSSVQTAFADSVSLGINPKYKILEKLGIYSATQRRFDECMDYVTRRSIELVEECKLRYQSDPSIDLERRFLPQLLGIESLSFDQKISVIFDMMLAASDTTTYSLVIALYHLAKNPAAQEALREEIDANCGSTVDQPLTPTTMSRLRYLKAVLRESARLKPIIPTNARVLVRDVVLQGYRVPEGTTVLIEHEFASRSPNHFEEPETYRPERWLRDEDGAARKDRGNPFLVMPFGFGPRMCVGRRFAEQELIIGLVKMIQAFRVEFEGDVLPLKGIGFDKTPVTLNFRLFER